MARTSKYTNINKAVPSTAKWRAGLYLRLSKEDGDKDDDGKLESDSISSQRLIIEDFLIENPDIDVVSKYSDDGYTGANFDRPEFLRMIEDIRLGRVNCVIVKDLSRFGRNYLEAGQYLDIFFPVMDVRFVSVNDNIDSYLFPSSMDNISVSFKNVMNEEYCRDISKKVRSTFVAKFENGEYLCGFALYGYERDPNNRGKLLVDPKAASVIKQIFQWFAEGKTYRWITFKLNELGVPSPSKYKAEKYPNYRRDINRKGLWCIQTIKNILQNRTYAGDLVQGVHETISHKVKKLRKIDPDKWVIIENHHEAIVDKNLYFNLQKMINRDMRASQKTKELALFSGFLKCADCGRQLVKKMPGHKNLRELYHYYTCSTYDMQTKAACTRHTTRSDILERVVLTVISKYIDMAVVMEELIEAINKSPKKTAATEKIEALFQEKRKEKIKIENILLDLYPDYKNELISRAQYLLLKEKYENEISNINAVINNLSQILEQEKEGIDGSNEFIKNFTKFKYLDKLTREVLIALIDVIYVHEGGGLEIVFKFQDAFKRAVDYINANKTIIDNNRFVPIDDFIARVSMEVAV